MKVRAIVTFVLALAAVHLLLSWPAFLAAPQLLGLSRLAPDAAIVLAIALIGVVSGRRRRGLHVAAALVVISVLFGTVAAEWPKNFDRAFELRDAEMIWGLPHLLFDLEPSWLNTAIIVLPLVAAVYLIAWFSLSRLAAAGGRRGAVLWTVVLQALVLAGVVRPSIWHDSQCGAFGRELAGSLGDWFDHGGDPSLLPPPPGAEKLAAAPADLRGLEGADVHVIFIESYGRVALRHDDIARHLRELYRQLEAELAAAGYAAISGACRPAVSGGGSELAHAQLFAAVAVPDYRMWERLQYCKLNPLPRLFADAGYLTVEVMPAMPRHWPEGAKFFGFAEQVTELELGYEGFTYHFGKMPDQFALHHLLERVVKPATRPVFSTFISVTSHQPCRHIPPYIEDWNISPTTFAGRPARSYDRSWFDVAGSPDTAAAYGDALGYSLRAAVGFTCRLTRPSIVVVLGDHQPPIKKELVPSDKSHDVPIHVFANRPQLLEALAPLQLRPGLDVPEDVTAFDSADFAPTFMRAFSRPE
ncbi:MAG: hypothetical protein KDC98_04890 [Planctomycetes bacterium]|nr:hypothetical protein [Planctomycetota bacterium]